MRKTGILMPVSSLPSRTGVGEMGAEAYRFLALLKENGVRIWQILVIQWATEIPRISPILPVQEMNCISAWIRYMKKGCYKKA